MDRREVEANLRPMIRHPTDPRVCVECQKQEDKEIVFFDPKCRGCQELLESPNTSISELFAILRQWSQPVQQSLELIIRQILQAGAHVDDRDGLNDMTMLHYAVKAGTRGMGDAEESCRMVRLLLSRGADPYIRCRWTNMAAIHYAIYFDVAPVVAVLLDATKAVDVDSPCSEFDHGTPLHIAARCLALNSARELLEFGADPTVRDMTGRLTIDWLPDGGCFDPDSETGKILSSFRQLLQDARPPTGSTSLFSLSPRETDNIVRILNTFGINVGDKVLVGGVKTGILRYCGPTLFANGFWAGIELDEAVGKNNGSIDGIQYFKCPPNYGIFAPLTKISKPGHLLNQSQSSPLHHSRVKLDHVTAKVNTGLKQSKSDTTHGVDVVDIDVGDRVLVANKRTGVVMYRGETEFAPGLWFGIELDKPVGKNDGSINGKQYFSCQQNYGVFAPSSRIQKLTDSVVVNNSFKLLSQKAASTMNIHRRPSTESSLNLHTPHTPDKNHLNRSKVFNSVSTKGSPLSPLTNSSSGELKLVEGMNVFCNGEIGVLCYMGAVDFADGIWLGVELRTPKGKHDGSVQGRRYFTCRLGHGLLVRPNRVSVRGINGARLISAD